MWESLSSGGLCCHYLKCTTQDNRHICASGPRSIPRCRIYSLLNLIWQRHTAAGLLLSRAHRSHAPQWSISLSVYCWYKAVCTHNRYRLEERLPVPHLAIFKNPVHVRFVLCIYLLYFSAFKKCSLGQKRLCSFQAKAEREFQVQHVRADARFDVRSENHHFLHGNSTCPV